MKSNPNRLWLVAFALGWLFDFLFWENEPGINFAIYVILCLAGGMYILLGVEKAKPARNALWLLIPILFFATVTFIRGTDDHRPCPLPDPLPDGRPRHHLPRGTLDLVRAVRLYLGLSQAGREHALQAADVLR